MSAQDPFAYSLSDIPRAAVGSSQSVLAGNFILSFDAVAERLEATFANRGLSEERFAAERSGPAVGVLALVTLSMLAVAAVSLLVRLRPKRHLILVGITTWILLYAAVALGQEPADPEVWLPVLPAVWILVGIVVFQPATSAVHRYSVGAVVALLFAHSIVGGFLVLGDGEDDLNARRSSLLTARAEQGDFVLTAGLPPFTSYLSYHSEAQVIPLQSLPIGLLDEVYQQVLASADDVYATADVFSPPNQVLVKDSTMFRALEQFGNKIRPDFSLVVENDVDGVYQRTSP